MLLIYIRITVYMTSSKRTKAAVVDPKRFVFRNISILLFFFSVSWLPNYLIKLTGFASLIVYGQACRNAAIIMFYSNIVIDPLIYTCGSPDFRGKLFGRAAEKVTTALRKFSQGSSTELNTVSLSLSVTTLPRVRANSLNSTRTLSIDGNIRTSSIDSTQGLRIYTPHKRYSCTALSNCSTISENNVNQ